jgi:hypothetical protein
VADGAPVFTDDVAPVEEMTRRMLAERGHDVGQDGTIGDETP